MSDWQTAGEIVLDLSHSTPVQRVVEFIAGNPASLESFVMRWLPIVLRLTGLKSDQAQLLSMIAGATWALGCVVCGSSRQPNRDSKRTSRLVRSLNSFGVKKLPAARLLISPSVG
jgi:hypothetical protein